MRERAVMRTNLVLMACVGALVLCPTASADVIIDLGGGWQATIFDEDDVSLAVDFVSLEDNLLVIQKFANFDSIDPLTGLPDPARILFNQIADDDHTVSRIFIADEIIGMIETYINDGEAKSAFSVIVVPQDREERAAIEALLPNVRPRTEWGGKIYYAGVYHSRGYAEMMSEQYQGLNLFSTVKAI